MIEIAGMAARDGHEETELVRLLETVLDALGPARATPGRPGTDTAALLVAAAFDLKFLELQGLSPALVHCASCGEAGADTGARRVPFSNALGGRLCARCASGERTAMEIPGGVLRVAQSLLDTPVAQLARIHLSPERTLEVRGFVRRFLEYHLEARPRVRFDTRATARPMARTRAAHR